MIFFHLNENINEIICHLYITLLVFLLDLAQMLIMIWIGTVSLIIINIGFNFINANLSTQSLGPLLSSHIFRSHYTASSELEELQLWL